MVIRTSITLGTQATPNFVGKEFYEAFDLLTSTYEVDHLDMPDTIMYSISGDHVVDRDEGKYQFHEMLLDDAHLIPRCRRRNLLHRVSYKKRQAEVQFDRFAVHVEDINYNYFLLAPGSMFYAVNVYKKWKIKFLTYNNLLWEVHMREIYVDPYDTSSTIWFFDHPKYQITLCTGQDFRDREDEMKRVVLAMLPRSFRWD